MTPRRVFIAGSGAIGSLFAARLLQHKTEVWLLPRTPTQQDVFFVGAQEAPLSLPCYSGAFPELTANDFLIVPLKCYDIASFIAQWATHVSPHTPILLLHNGMGGREALRQHLPQQPLLQGTTRQAALRETRQQVRATGQGLTLIGPAPDNPAATDIARLHACVALLAAAIPPVQWQQDINLALWEKLLINAVINPLTAVLNIPNGALASTCYTPFIHALCAETVTVMQAAGIHTEVTDALQRIYQVIEATATNFSSMQQDVLHQRPTEIDAITGYVLTTAQKRGLMAPLNNFLYQTVKAQRRLSCQQLMDAYEEIISHP